VGKTSIPVIQKETVTALPARRIVSVHVEFTDDSKRFAWEVKEGIQVEKIITSKLRTRSDQVPWMPLKRLY